MVYAAFGTGRAGRDWQSNIWALCRFRSPSAQPPQAWICRVFGQKHV